MTGNADGNDIINHYEWKFNEISEDYDKFPLEAVTSEAYDGWLHSYHSNGSFSTLKVIPIDFVASNIERRYEIIDKDTGLVHIRIKTIETGSRLYVFSRGPKWFFRDPTNHNSTVVLRYYVAYKDFYRDMIEFWHLDDTESYTFERERYPENHKIFETQMVKFQPLKSIEYTKAKTDQVMSNLPTLTETNISQIAESSKYIKAEQSTSNEVEQNQKTINPPKTRKEIYLKSLNEADLNILKAYKEYLRRKRDIFPRTSYESICLEFNVPLSTFKRRIKNFEKYLEVKNEVKNEASESDIEPKIEAK